MLEQDGEYRTDQVRNEEVLQRVKEERNILQTVRRKKNYYVGPTL
jgi:hypothetical protein